MNYIASNPSIEAKLADAVARIEARLLETKTPCKLYSSSLRASAAAAKVTDAAMRYFGAKSVTCYYVRIPSVNRYATVYDLTSLLNKHGGYVGFFADRGFYSI
jgi:alkylation response protein AidB-like acyl-CoA dehydrogenase